jgi:hypothetical protein
VLRACDEQVNGTAYLVALLRADGSYALAIFSEPCPTIIGSARTAVISIANGKDYSSARKQLLADITRDLSVEIARFGEDPIRAAKGLPPRRHR